MSINRGDNNDSGKTQGQQNNDTGAFGASFDRSAGAQNAGGQQRENQSRSERRRGGGGLINAISRASGTVSRKRAGADLQKLEKAVKENLPQFESKLEENTDYRVLLLDAAALNMRLDLLVISVAANVNGAAHETVFTYLIEDGSYELPAHTLTVAGQPYRYATVTGEAWTQDLWGRISAKLEEASGRKLELHNAGHMVLPTEFDVTDPDAIYDVLVFGTEAILRTSIQEVYNSTNDVISVADIGEDAALTAHVDFRTVNDQTATRLPLRGDIDIGLRYTEQSGNNKSSNAFQIDTAVPIAGVQGYMDLSFRAPEQAAWGQPQPTQHYFARFIMTRLDTRIGIITPELQLLGLAVSTILQRNLTWARIWSPQFRSREANDIHDIGAIGYEVAFGDAENERIDTRSAAFGDSELARLVMLTIHDKPIYTMHIEEAGELTWLNRTILAAAEGNQDANDSLVAALDNLSNGNFSRLWNNRGPLVQDDLNRIHNGYYLRDGDSVRRDIRDLDYLMMLNLFGEKDPALVEKFQATYDDIDEDAEIRLARREDMILRVLGPTVRFTGYSRQVSWYPEALEVVMEALDAAGLTIRPENTQIGFNARTARGRADIGNMAFGASSQANRIFGNTGSTGGGRGFGRGTFGNTRFR